MDAETAYIFRHALLSSAAYDLQLPGERARLHLLALQILEQTPAGRTDAAALELARHAQQAQAQRRTINLVELKQLAEKECGYLARATRHAMANFDFATALQAAARLAVHPAGTPLQQASGWMTQGEVERQYGRMARARAMFEKAAGLTGQPGLEKEHARALRGIAISLRRTPESATGVELMRRALDLLSRAGDEQAVAVFRIDLSVLEGDRGDNPGALELLQDATRVQRELGNPDLLAVALLTLADALIRAGKLEEADHAIEEADALNRQTGHPMRRAGLALSRASLRRAQGRRAAAAREAERSLELRRQLGDESGQVAVLALLAVLAGEDGDHQRATRLSYQLMALCEETGDQFWHAVARMNLGVWLEQAGRLEESEQCSRSAAQDLTRLGDLRSAAIATGNLASALKSQGRLDDALEAYRRAVAALERMGVAVSLGLHLGGMAEALARKGDPGLRPEAEQCYARSCRLLSEAGATSQLADILRRWSGATGAVQTGGESEKPEV